MEKAELTSTSSQDTVDRIKVLLRNLGELERSPTSIDMTRFQWATPLGILPLAMKISALLDEGKSTILYPTTGEISNYLNTVKFPRGETSAPEIEKHSTYLPIRRISVLDDVVLERSLAKYESILTSFLQGQKNKLSLSSAIRYLISEMTTNVQEHADCVELWLFSQYWPATRTSEICIADCGIGMIGSYRKAQIEVVDDVDALEKAARGLSAKKENGLEQRGFGIPSSMKLITKSPLKGEFLLLSGKGACFFKAEQKRQLYTFHEAAWQGVIACIRIRHPETDIDIHDYID